MTTARPEAPTRPARREQRRRGLCVAFLGIDGSGKSTLLRRLMDAPPEWCTGVSVRHLSPLELRRRAGDSSQPHLTPPRGLVMSLLKSAFWLGEYVAGYRMKVAPELASGRLVLFDRYLVDALIDPRRYRYGAPRWVLRLVWRLVPKPDLFVFLDAPVDVLRSRKQEVAPEAMQRLRAAYRSFAAKDPRWHIVDVSENVDQALTNVITLLSDAAIAQRALSQAGR